ncbi:MAG: site-2 protease family protein [Desulfovibrio sp.]
MFESNFADIIRDLSLIALPLLLGLTCHEAAHGFVAYLLGDPTAKQQGRLSLNPLKHLDPLGTFAFLITRMIGWAKPVPVNAGYFRDPQKGMMLVALAGPGANFIVAILFAFILHFVTGIAPTASAGTVQTILEPIANIAYVGVRVNLTLMIFNLLPIPPLDGSNVVAGLLPPVAAYKYMSFAKWGMPIVVIIALLGGFSLILWPAVSFVEAILLF